jgi:hypothetical protein
VDWMVTREIRCIEPDCGTLNRVPGHSITKIARCGKCHTALPESAPIKSLQQLYRFRKFAFLAVIGLVVALANLVPSSSQSPKSSPAADICATRHQPSQGPYFLYGAFPQIAPLTVKTAIGSDYFVKMEEAGSGLPVVALFIHGGSSVTANMPLGSFVLKYAAGTFWCGPKELFGSDTSTFKANDVFTFEREFTGDGYTTTTWEVELIKQVGGNLRTHSIPRHDF